MEVYQPPSKNSIWANGESQIVEPAAAVEHQVVPEVAVPEDESDNEYQVISKKPKVAAETTAASAPAPATAQPPTAEKPTTETDTGAVDAGEAMEDVQEAPAAEQGPVSDVDWLRSRTNRVLELVEDDEDPTASVSAPQAPALQPHTAAEAVPVVVEAQPEQPQHEAEQPQEAAPEEEDKIRETGRLYLRNLHYEVTEDEIREQFSKHGPLEEVSNYLFFLTPPMQ